MARHSPRSRSAGATIRTMIGRCMPMRHCAAETRPTSRNLRPTKYAGVRWRVAQQIRIGARTFETKALFDDQELDSRVGNGIVYWEGASELLEHGNPVGHGYLELTGYAAPMRR